MINLMNPIKLTLSRALSLLPIQLVRRPNLKAFRSLSTGYPVFKAKDNYNPFQHSNFSTDESNISLSPEQQKLSSVLQASQLPISLARNRYQFLLELSVHSGGLEGAIRDLQNLGFKPYDLGVVLRCASQSQSLLNPSALSTILELLADMGVSRPTTLLAKVPQIIDMSPELLADRLTHLCTMVYKREAAKIISCYPSVVLRSPDQVSAIWDFLIQKMSLDPSVAAKSRVWDATVTLDALRRRFDLLSTSGQYNPNSQACVDWVLGKPGSKKTFNDHSDQNMSVSPSTILTEEEKRVLNKMQYLNRDKNTVE